MKRAALAAAFLFLSLPLLGARSPRPVPAPSCPDWLRQAAAVPLSDAQKASPAVVLYDERVTSVLPSGDVTTHRLYAAKVLTAEGRSAASLRELYLTDSDNVQVLRGWVIRPSGEVRELGKEDIVDVALAGNDVYNEVRARQIGLGPNPEPGVVFGAEVTTLSRSIFSQFEWTLQDEWPVVRVARSLVVSSGLVTFTTFNHPALQPAVSGNAWTWELRDLPRIADEPDSAPWTSITPRVAVSVHNGPGGADRPAFNDWSGVSRWLASLTDPAASADASVQAKARELAAGARTPVDAIRAIAGFVQHIQYVSIQMGVSRGGGYKPRPAAQVLAKGHGDCKDKAALLKAMLAASGQPSFLVSLFSGDPTYVRDTWPSPHQFNHVIVGIPITEGSYPGATVEAPGLGRLLLFDPTDAFTPLGELPQADQGGLALVASASGGPLVRLPEADPSANTRDRAIAGQVDATGRLNATVSETFTGDRAAAAREKHRGLAAEAYNRETTERLTRTFPGAQVGGIKAEDGERTFKLGATVAAPGYAQIVQGRLLLVRCPTTLAGFLPTLGTPTRRTPVALEPSRTAETFVLTPAAGFTVDELPADVQGESPYGSYRLKARREGDKVIVEREIITRRAIVPVNDYAAVKAFVERARAVDGATVVLARTPRP